MPHTESSPPPGTHSPEVDEFESERDALMDAVREGESARRSVTEYEVLDLIYESLPENASPSLYGVRTDLPRAEFYIKVRGECWRVLAEPHPHRSTPRDLEDSCCTCGDPIASVICHHVFPPSGRGDAQ